MRITYEIITPESAEEGDAEERGFVEPKFQIHVPIGEIMESKADWPDSDLEWTLQDAARFLGTKCMEDAGTWFVSIDPVQDFQTGAETRHSLHPDNVTPATYDRLKRIFCYD